MRNRRLSRISLALTAATLLPIVAACGASTPAPAPAASPSAPVSYVPKPAATDAVNIVRAGNDLPAPITRKESQKVVVTLETIEVVGQMADGATYTYWTYGGKVPGPMVRVRQGDTVELHLKNSAKSKNAHSIDLHAVNGPGGGAGATQVAPGEEKVFTFKALNPGTYVYHCGTAHIPTHIGQGMYGMIVVEPTEGLPKVDKEFYVMQGEFYTKGDYGVKGHLEYDSSKLRNEDASFVTFNGKAAGLMGDLAMNAKTGEKIRMFVGNGGPNLISSFHIIGEIFDTVHKEGANETLSNVQTTLIPVAGASVVELTADVPGTYVLVDHSITRAIDKGAVGGLVIEGPDNKDVFSAPAGTGSGH